MVIIVADNQERRSGVPEHLRDMGAIVSEERLDAGDYLLSRRVGVERKRAFDFVTAIIQKRFYLQLERLKSAYLRPLYIIEGRQLYGLRNVHPNFIRGALATIAVEYSIPTLFTHDAKDTAALLFLIARREQQGAEHAVSSVDTLAARALLGGSKKPEDLQSQQLQVLAAIPLIGRYRARQLLERFGTIAHLAVATEDALASVPGIGIKTARRINRVLSTSPLLEAQAEPADSSEQ